MQGYAQGADSMQGLLLGSHRTCTASQIGLLFTFFSITHLTYSSPFSLVFASLESSWSFVLLFNIFRTLTSRIPALLPWWHRCAYASKYKNPKWLQRHATYHCYSIKKGKVSIYFLPLFFCTARPQLTCCSHFIFVIFCWWTQMPRNCKCQPTRQTVAQIRIKLL